MEIIHSPMILTSHSSSGVMPMSLYVQIKSIHPTEFLETDFAGIPLLFVYALMMAYQVGTVGKGSATQIAHI